MTRKEYYILNAKYAFELISFAKKNLKNYTQNDLADRLKISRTYMSELVRLTENLKKENTTDPSDAKVKNLVNATDKLFHYLYYHNIETIGGDINYNSKDLIQKIDKKFNLVSRLIHNFPKLWWTVEDLSIFKQHKSPMELQGLYFVY